MLGFVVLAAVLAVAAVAVVSFPLLRPLQSQAAPARRTVLVVSATLIVGALTLYFTWGERHWLQLSRADASAVTPQAMVAQLARRLEAHPDDLQGWLMLGRSYLVLEEFPLALRAFTRADTLAGGRNTEALLGQAESLATPDPSQLDGRAGVLIDRALQVDPNSGRAVFFGATLAERHGDWGLARERFGRVLQMDLPQSVRDTLQRHLAELDQRIAQDGSRAPAAPASSAATGAQPTATPRAGDTDATSAPTPRAAALDAAAAAPAAGAGTTAALEVRVKVELSTALATAAGAAPLFVFVRDPDSPGPPLAVKRLSSRFPQTVSLSAADAMTAASRFSPGQRLQVVARIARGGSPLARSGDPYGEALATVGGPLQTVAIDKVTP